MRIVSNVAPLPAHDLTIAIHGVMIRLSRSTPRSCSRPSYWGSP